MTDGMESRDQSAELGEKTIRIRPDDHLEVDEKQQQN